MLHGRNSTKLLVEVEDVEKFPQESEPLCLWSIVIWFFIFGDIMAAGRRKIAVIGAGNVGATCAFVLAQMKVADIVLLDIYEGFAKGKALDMSQNANVLNYDGRITGTADYTDIAGAEVVVVTSGFPRQPGMTREDLIGKNADIVSQVGEGIRNHAPDSTIVMVTNPLD